MKKVYLTFAAVVAISMSFLTGCSKDIAADLNTEQLNSCNNFEIPVDEALKTLSEFLETEELTTKSSALSNGEFTVEKWPRTNGSKAVASSALSVYCVDFSKDKGSAILAADSRLSDKIYSVTDTKITAADLDAANTQLRQFSTTNNSLIDFNTLSEAKIKDTGKSFAINLVCKSILDDSSMRRGDEGPSGSSDNEDSSSQVIKYGPYLTTKWGQAEPFNNNMNGTPAGCGPIAAAQVIYYFRSDVEPRENWAWNWDKLKEVTPSTFDTCSDDAKRAAADFVSEVKFRCNMKPSDTQAVVGDIKRCLKNFGFTDVRYDFAHFGGDAHDIKHINDNIENMIKCEKPVIMLSGTWDSSADFFKWIQGHAYVLDGYKKDNTGEYLHINWGWYGAYDGYYAKGCFDLTKRAGYEESVDYGISGNDTVDFNFFHYYVYF